MIPPRTGGNSVPVLFFPTRQCQVKNIVFHEYVSKFAFSRPRTRMRAHLANARAMCESPADTVNLVVTNYPEMYLDVNRVAFKKHTDLLLFLVLSVK